MAYKAAAESRSCAPPSRPIPNSAPPTPRPGTKSPRPSNVRSQLFLPYTSSSAPSASTPRWRSMPAPWSASPPKSRSPTPQRLREYTEARLPSLEQQLFSAVPVYRSLEIATLTESLTRCAINSAPPIPPCSARSAARTPAEAAKAYIDGSKLDDPAVRKQLYRGRSRCRRRQHRSAHRPHARHRSPRPPSCATSMTIRSMPSSASTPPASPRRASPSRAPSSYPDATFTLRLSYGTIKGYEQNRQAHRALHHHRRSL